MLIYCYKGRNFSYKKVRDGKTTGPEVKSKENVKR